MKGEGYLEPDVAPAPVITFAEVAESYLQYQQNMMNLGHLKPYTLYRSPQPPPRRPSQTVTSSCSRPGVDSYRRASASRDTGSP